VAIACQKSNGLIRLKDLTSKKLDYHITTMKTDPDIEENFGGRCEDAPCCGCCGNEAYESAMEYERQHEERFDDEPSGWSPDEESPDEESDEYEGGEDSYLDSYWEDQSEYGMEGCCGDF
jgi:hypothetical protein